MTQSTDTPMTGTAATTAAAVPRPTKRVELRFTEASGLEDLPSVEFIGGNDIFVCFVIRATDVGPWSPAGDYSVPWQQVLYLREETSE